MRFLIPVLNFIFIAVSGFTIPEGTPDGVYMTRYDEHGNAIVKRLAEPSGFATISKRGTSNDARTLATRDVSFECGNYELSHEECDQCVGDLYHELAIRNGWLWHGYEVWSVHGSTVAYVCNFGDSDFNYHPDWLRGDYDAVTTRCGTYGAGWRTDQTGDYWISTGYEWVNGDRTFCGKDHDSDVPPFEG